MRDRGNLMKLDNRKQSEIDNLSNEIEAAKQKYEEALANNEPEAVKNAIQRTIQFLSNQVNKLKQNLIE